VDEYDDEEEDDSTTEHTSEDDMAENSFEEVDTSEDGADSFFDSDLSEQNDIKSDETFDKNGIDVANDQIELKREGDGSSFALSSPDNSLVAIPNDIDDIGKEFYEYINSEFAPHQSKGFSMQMDSMRKEPEALNQSDRNNNPVHYITLEDDDFW